MTSKERSLFKVLIIVLLAAIVSVSVTEVYRKYRDRLNKLQEMVQQTRALEIAAGEVPALKERRTTLREALDAATMVPIKRKMDIVEAGRAVSRIAESSGVHMQRLSPGDSGLTVSSSGTVPGLLSLLERLYLEQPELSVESASLDSYHRPGMAELSIVVRYENNTAE